MMDDVDYQDDNSLYVNLILVVEKQSGQILHLSKMVPEEEEIRKFYIPQFDVSLNGSFLGTAYDNVNYRKFFIKTLYTEENKYISMVNDLLSAGWTFSYDSFLD